MSEDVKPVEAGATTIASTATEAAPEAASSVSGAAPVTSTTETQQQTVDWRAKIAGEDKSFIKTLEKYTDESAFGKAHQALLQKLGSGEYKKTTPFPDKGTPEQQAQWRADNSIPDKPEAYDVNIGNGVVWGEADKPLLDDFVKHAHGKNLSPDAVKASLEWYNAFQAKTAAARDEADANFKQASEDALRAEWGGDYRRNINAMENLLNGLPDVKAKLEGARGPDGRPLGFDPAIIKWLAQTSFNVNGENATVLPPGEINVAGIDSEIGRLEGLMRSDRRAYDRDPANGNKLLELYDRRAAMKSRAA
jgi:hypothetical protein